MKEPTIIQIIIDVDSTGLLTLKPGATTVGSTGDNLAQRLVFSLEEKLVEKYTAYDTLEIQLWVSKESFVPLTFNASQPETWIVDLTNRLTAETTLNVQAVFTQGDGTDSVVREATSQQALKLRSVHNAGEAPIEPKPNTWEEFVAGAYAGVDAQGSVITLYNLSGAR